MLKDRNRKEQFYPTAYSVVFNPYYFNRRAIHRGIKKYSDTLGGKLLDFGCGNKPYKQLFRVDEYLGIELEHNEGHDNPSDKADDFYDGNRLPYEDDTFDCVFSTEVFEHVFNLEDMLKEINRVHKNGGLLLVTMPFVWHEHEMPNDFARYTSSGIRSLLEKSHYSIEAHQKEPSHIVSVMQLLNSYVFNRILPGSNFLKFVLAPITIFPINLIGLLAGILLPKSEGFYINHVILAKNNKSIRENS